MDEVSLKLNVSKMEGEGGSSVEGMAGGSEVSTSVMLAVNDCCYKLVQVDDQKLKVKKSRSPQNAKPCDAARP